MKFFGVLSLCVISLLVPFQTEPVGAQWATAGANGIRTALKLGSLGSGLATGGAGYSLLPSAGLSLLNPLKGAGPLLGLVAAKLGLMGPMKMALLSKAGLALGVIGTALGGAALKVSLQNKNSYGYDHYNDVDTYTHYDHGDSYYRKKRDISQFNEPLFGDYLDEHNFDYVQKSDPKRCTERLICELSAKSRANPEPMAMDELAILSMVKSKSTSGYKSKAHHLYEIAARQGVLHNNCHRVYSSCQYSGEELMSLVRFLGSGFESEDPKNIIKYVRS